MSYLDIYDDPSGSLLVQRLREKQLELPEKLAGAQLLEPSQLEALPDRLFALVTPDGLRKYAMHDEAHLVTSVIYFMDKAASFDPSSRASVAANLVNACAWYDVEPPEPLVKLALGLGGAVTGALTAAGGLAEVKDRNQQNRENFEAFRRAQVSGMKTASGVVVDPKSGESTVLSASKKMDDAGLARLKVDRQFGTTDRIDGGDTTPSATPFGTKLADLQGTEMMPVAGGNKPLVTDPKKPVGSKVASFLPKTHLRATPTFTAPEPEPEKHAHFVFPHEQRFPIDTPELVKRADAYFQEWKTAMRAADRHVFASAVEKRASALGVKVSSAILEYAGDDYGPNIHAELVARRSLTEGTGHDTVYEVLSEKVAHIPAHAMASLLAEADAVVGIDASYGRPGVGVRDPYAAVFGKTAAVDTESTWSWSEGSDYTNAEKLRKLGRHKPKALDELFGEGFGVSFCKDPVGVFRSMPDPQKVVIARLAADQ
jgi:hypothetical protein